MKKPKKVKKLKQGDLDDEREIAVFWTYYFRENKVEQLFGF